MEGAFIKITRTVAPCAFRHNWTLYAWTLYAHPCCCKAEAAWPSKWRCWKW